MHAVAYKQPREDHLHHHPYYKEPCAEQHTLTRPATTIHTHTQTPTPTHNMAAKERESAVSEMANWSKAVHSEMQHQKNWHQNWHYLSKDAGPASMTDRIQGLKDQLA